jgi:hypothetical protein
METSLSALIEVTRVATAVGAVNSLLYMGTVTVTCPAILAAVPPHSAPCRSCSAAAMAVKTHPASDRLTTCLR